MNKEDNLKEKFKQALISTVPKPGWGLTSHQRSFTDLIISASIKLFVNFVK